MNLPSLKNLNVSNKTVLVRAGFDVPLENGKVMDDFRLLRALETLEYLAKQKARVVILSHLGRPEGWDETFSLLPVCERLAHLLKRKLVSIPAEAKRLPEYEVPHIYLLRGNVETDDVKSLLDQMPRGEIAVLENLRFYEGETKNDPEFAKKLAKLGDVYVNEAFSNSHREHASMVELPKLLPSATGLGVEKEISVLSRASQYPKRPFVMMIGGAKVESKIGALSGLLKVADHVLLGGGLSNLFLRLKGYEIGKSNAGSKADEKIAKNLYRTYKDKLVLPLDVVVSRSEDGRPECVKVDKVSPGEIMLDVGPETILLYSKIIKEAQTLLWNGPLGHFEQKQFSHGTVALSRLLASRSGVQAFVLAGGGETLEVIRRQNLASHFDHVSTGGGAMLIFLGSGNLPALKALEKDAEV